MTKKVKVYSSKAGVTRIIDTEASMWSELKEELINKDWYNPQTMKAINRENKMSFDSADIEIVEGMTIFLLPTKNDSGVELTEDQLYEFAEELKSLIDEKVEEYLNGVEDSEQLEDEALALAASLRRG